MMRKFRFSLALVAALALFPTAFLFAQGASQARLPADFPKDVPLYPGATVKSAGQTAKEMVILETPDTKEKPLAFYKTELPKNGWKLEKAFSGSPDALQGAKGNRMISMAVLAHGGKNGRTLIQIGLLGGN